MVVKRRSLAGARGAGEGSSPGDGAARFTSRNSHSNAAIRASFSASEPSTSSQWAVCPCRPFPRSTMRHLLLKPGVCQQVPQVDK